MNEITIAQEKARDAIDLLKEAVFAIVRHEAEAGSGVRQSEISLKLEERIILPLKRDGTWGKLSLSYFYYFRKMVS